MESKIVQRSQRLLLAAYDFCSVKGDLERNNSPGTLFPFLFPSMGYFDLFSVVAKKYLSLNYFLSKEVYLAHQYSCYLTKIFLVSLEHGRSQPMVPV